MTVSVLLVDDHELVRDGIRQLLSQTLDIKVVGCAASGEEAIQMVQSTVPDVVLMDINMPGIGGVEASLKILRKFPTVKIIALTVRIEGPLPQQLLSAGVSGYLSKNCEFSELLKAIRTVGLGKRYIANEIASLIVCGQQQQSACPFDHLSVREMQIVEYTLEGKSIQEIAEVLKISSKTVNTYRYRVHEKLGVKNDVELTRLASKHRLIQDN
jgi:two-component system invasion response regulator UvrY